MDLKTKYLGMELKSPLIVSASPLSDRIENIKQMEDFGASAVVLYSLFQEQLEAEQRELDKSLSDTRHISAEAISYYPEPNDYILGPEAYLNHIQNAKAAVNIPVIASLNGSTLGGWTNYAKDMQQAGADAIELNIYKIPNNQDHSADIIEQEYIDIIKSVKSVVNIPIAVKLSPYFSNLSNMGKKIQGAGAGSLVLFNRFYQPDINLNDLTVDTKIALSHSGASRIVLRWIAMLKGKINLDFAATSGIHLGLDVVKALMVGANAVMMASVLLKHGIEHLKIIENELSDWMTDNEYESVNQMIGSMSQSKVEDPGNYERAQYMKAITGYKY